MIQPREEEHEYNVSHKDGYFYIVTNKDDSTNFKFMRTQVNKLGKENWEEIYPHNEKVRLIWTEAFEDFIVLFKRQVGLINIEIFFGINDKRNHDISLPEPVYGVWSGENYEYSTNNFRLRYTSLVTPMSTFDYDVKSKKLQLKKEEEIKNYNKDDFVTTRKFITARDGKKIPISIVHRKDIETPAPTYLYGYGSYGYSMDPYFSPTILSLTERGYIYVIAHVRGGGELGRQWYEDGRVLKKKNTFYDFIDSAEYLMKEGITTKDQLAIGGGSAGGLLVGAVVTMRPDLCNLVIAEVPFVDVINTMLDETIPLTAQEWKEWGNPKDKESFDYIMTYSPYDNIKKADYPHIIVTTGLNDPRVAFWEPAKFVAKFRALKTDNNDLILKTNMGAGHSGASGRYESMKEKAFIYSNALDKAGLIQKKE